MSDAVIRVENLSKKYILGHQQEGNSRYKALRDVITDGAKSFGKRLLKPNGKQNCNPASEEFWALKDVSFEIKQGDRVGIIGRNGAGKSTLLKILSRITEPTGGQITIKGRIASLLEVGTGFHPELTGRENIFLNGAILGMSKTEIKRKFDEIVDFAEVEKFLDTPVKRYSSGMYVRLAFAVAAHLEPEILIVDEVLAVGDMQFQKKCLGKMEEVGKEGRTVLFVSHNMATISQLCSSAILLKQGLLSRAGSCQQTIEYYLTSLSSQAANFKLEKTSERSGDGRLRFTDAYLHNEGFGRTESPIAGHPIDIVLEFTCRQNLSNVNFGLTIFNQMGIAVTHCNIASEGKVFKISEQKGQIICHIPKLPLPLGRYRIAASAYDNFGQLDLLPNVCVFDIETSNFFSAAWLPPIEYSSTLIEHSWSLILEKDIINDYSSARN